MTASIVSIDALDLVVDDTVWPFAQIRRAEIDACFEAARRAKPELWNGRILLLHRYAIENGTLRGAFLETDFASLFSWREWGWPEVGIRDCFAAAAIESVDGAFLLGVMGSHIDSRKSSGLSMR
ncbi:MAG: hypothetical protein JO254_00330 [Pseudolabrys sp.]|nr:hypothetical protein [Pseudolabrys sp.]